MEVNDEIVQDDSLAMDLVRPHFDEVEPFRFKTTSKRQHLTPKVPKRDLYYYGNLKC